MAGTRKLRIFVSFGVDLQQIICYAVLPLAQETASLGPPRHVCACRFVSML
jgi:hypothetical protein